MAYIFDSFLNGFYILALGVVPYIGFAYFMQIMSKSLKKGISAGFWRKLFIYITAPGVIIHELGHIIFCFIFGHEILNVGLFTPDSSGTIGYVNHRYNPKNYYHRIGNFFIGTGPIWFGVTMLFLFSWLLLPNGMIGHGEDLKSLFNGFFTHFKNSDFWLSWKTWLWLYLSFSTAAHITLSKSDFEGAKDGLILVIGVIFLISFALGWLGKWEEGLLKFEIHVLATLLSMMFTFIILLVIPITLLRLLFNKLKSKDTGPVEKQT